MSATLQFMVRVSSSEYARRPLTVKDWERVALKIAKAAKGRSNNRWAMVWVDQPYHHVHLDEHGKVSVQKGGHDIAFKK